jgi:hypothetical protein
VTAPQTKYDGYPGMVWNGNGWDLDCGCGNPEARVELVVGANGVEAESFWASGDPERQQHASPDEALARFLAEVPK